MYDFSGSLYVPIGLWATTGKQGNFLRFLCFRSEQYQNKTFFSDTKFFDTESNTFLDTNFFYTKSDIFFYFKFFQY